MNDISPLNIQYETGRESAWSRTAYYEKEERQMRSVSNIAVKGSVEVVFFRAPLAQLVVAGENQEAISSIKTRFEGDKLVIEQEGVSISGGGGNIHVSGSGNIVVGGDIYVGGQRSDEHMQFNAPVGGVVIGGGRCVVGIALPEAPSFRLKGSGDITLYDIQQSVLDIGLNGSGDITAYGQVEHLEAAVSGSGDVDVSDLTASSAALCVNGSGDIDAYVTQVVKARVSGSGDIVVRGNPATRDHRVSGSGDIKFKKR
ncbi:DUF2807 domain-containing protein (plasmid) [Halopseudomonas sp. SMJS2]|uniref:GIN domain-containing protein n=1 Tax=Halopseudomonas sp. SMJS2 TaxID=3041098 RepID=UPI0024535B90|nr:DUF2807 domain-containing protein [Halopseudomonas sp. SMJS2]WGK63491.1 DUF2807 domain-containing protein [Halopseudomonas sp. SMJS2]